MLDNINNNMKSYEVSPLELWSAGELTFDERPSQKAVKMSSSKARRSIFLPSVTKRPDHSNWALGGGYCSSDKDHQHL